MAHRTPTKDLGLEWVHFIQDGIYWGLLDARSTMAARVISRNNRQFLSFPLGLAMVPQFLCLDYEGRWGLISHPKRGSTIIIVPSLQAAGHCVQGFSMCWGTCYPLSQSTVSAPLTFPEGQMSWSQQMNPSQKLSPHFQHRGSLTDVSALYEKTGCH